MKHASSSSSSCSFQASKIIALTERVQIDDVLLTFYRREGCVRDLAVKLLSQISYVYLCK